jgi:CheY-like chemotaxis protein
VTQACHGLEALDRWQEHGPFDLLVTDVVMPEMGGPKLVEQLSLNYPSLKVLFVSGHTTDAIVRHGVQEAEVAYLQKPFAITDLVNKVREVLDS